MAHVSLSLRTILVLAAAVYGIGSPLGAQQNGAPYTVALDPKNSFGFFVLHANQPILGVGLTEWGDKAAWIGSPISHAAAADGKLSITGDTMTHHLIHAVEMSSPSPNSVTWNCDLTANSDVSFTLLSLIWGTLGAKEGSATLTTADGKDIQFPFPLQEGHYDNISKIVVQTPGSGSIEMALGSPLSVMPHGGDLFLRLAGNGWDQPSEVMAAGAKKSFSLTLTFPEKVAFTGSEAFIKSLADAKWFVFNPTDFTSPSAISMDDWLDKPAGKHGGVRMVRDHFQFEDGTPVKFWGDVNSYANNTAPSHVDAEKTAAFWARYGMNSIRCFDIGHPGWQGLGDPHDATKFDPVLLERFDYFMAQLASHGIYYRFSPTWSFPILPGNKGQVLNYDELMNFDPFGNKQKGSGTVELVNYAEDVQDLMIQKSVNLLNHMNPYTNKTYAQDPALCSFELQNEDDIFWWGTDKAFKACPTYAKKLTDRYVAWLKQRYGSQSGLQGAWGNALKPDETLDAGNIKLETAIFNFTTNVLAKAQGGARQRLLDNALFLHVVQDEFYAKFAKALRGTGYQGPIYASNWQAPEMLPHYYNLKSDAEIGQIDRHNYFGQGIFDTMLTNPGSGLLSSGMQQVLDRPFGLSEWSEVYPDSYGAEAPPLMAAYGMGLQGWAVSYEEQTHASITPIPPWAKKGFQIASATSMDTMAGAPPFGVWEADTPTQIGQYPVLTRMLYRGDVKEGDVISNRKVSESELEQGKFSFSEDYQQQGDVKNFTGGSVPLSALAAGRCVVQFTGQPEPSTFPDMTKYQNGTVITSGTGQLKWDSADKGFITINTDGTKAVVGFAQGKTQTLGNVTITSQSPFASIILTATDKASTLDTGSTAILCAVARQTNTGFTYSALDNTIVENGTAPILLEPVQADIAIKGRNIREVRVLDQSGIPTDQTLPVKDGAFHIDTGNEKTLYYEVVFK